MIFPKYRDKEGVSHMVQEQLEEVRQNIRNACERSGRKVEDVTLIAVSKTKPVPMLQEAYDAGARDFGENKVQEILEKEPQLPSDIRWHMIGHLQSRKSKLVAQNFNYLQSLDSITLARKLNKLLELEKKIMPVLLQFNVGGETNKHGWNASRETHWEQFLPDVAEIMQLPFLQVQGLMTMPPLEIELDKARLHFRKLCKLQNFFKEAFPGSSLNQLSMGTSCDYEAAIQEGATIIRVGQAILGPRVY